MSDGVWSYALDLDREPVSEHLFDGRVDPDDQVDLIGLEARERARLNALLEKHRRHVPERDVRARDVRIDLAIAERLRAMGYLQ